MIVRQAINQLGIDGSVLVIKNNKPYLRYATLNQPDTSYLINSVQKSMTACLIMREIQAGKLKMTTKLSKYYPQIPGSDQIKISNLLNMTAGLDLAKGEKLGSDEFVSDEDNIHADIQKTVFNEKLLGKWHYSSLNYVYLCGILMQIEHKSYEKLFKQTFVSGLNLKQTAFLWDDSAVLKAKHLPAQSYRYINGKYRVVNRENAILEAHNELGAGSVVMSNDDLAKVVFSMLHGKLLTNKSRKQLYKVSSVTAYNGGFYNRHKFKAANGAGEGYITFLRASDDGKTMLIIQTNYSNRKNFKNGKGKVNAIMRYLLAI